MTERYGKPNADLPAVRVSTAFAAASDYCHSPELQLLRLIEWLEKVNGKAATPDDERREQSRQFSLRVSRVVRRLISADACLSEREDQVFVLR